MVQSYAVRSRSPWEHSCIRLYCDISLWDTESSETPLHDTGKFMTKVMTTSSFMFCTEMICGDEADYRENKYLKFSLRQVTLGVHDWWTLCITSACQEFQRRPFCYGNLNLTLNYDSRRCELSSCSLAGSSLHISRSFYKLPWKKWLNRNS